MSYLEDYLESITQLPDEIRRSFAVMREKDSKSQELLASVDENMREYVKIARESIKRKQDPSPAMLNQARLDHKQCLALAEQKIQTAIQTYELVDGHIRRLDETLKQFDADLRAQEQQVHGTSGDGDEPATSTSISVLYLNLLPEKQKRAAGRGAPKSAIITAIVSPEASRKVPVLDGGIPIDPDEPRYCTCNRPSFGEMVGCDNPTCPIEWFHFECVGITATPKGRWMCKDCTDAKRKGLL